jgi:sortase (surface protein transpeptidase)
VASKVFSLFQISLENYFKTKFYLGLHLRLQPSEIENLYYYEYWYYVKNLQEYLKAKNKQQEDQQEQAEAQKNSYKMHKTPKMPKVPNLKTPSLKTPKL